jgi:Skp family chaperone for outer membrane proteins
MTLRMRFATLALMVILALAANAAARYYSTPLIVYVVEQTLLQKAPSSIGHEAIHNRFQKFLAAASERRSMQEELLALARSLEKNQQLSADELRRLLKEDDNAF